MHIYCISGLGADHRAFSRIQLEGYELIHVPWITHRPKETLSSYALRLGATIDRSSPFILLGLSFGGMLAMEMAAELEPQKLILVSSAESSSEIPLLYRLAGYLQLNALIPGSLIVKPNPLTSWMMGVRSAQDRTLFNAILERTDAEFAKWAVYAISAWKSNGHYPCFRVHGTRDKILPCPAKGEIIKNAGHSAVFTHSSELNEALARILKHGRNRTN